MREKQSIFLPQVVTVPHKGHLKAWELKADIGTKYCLQNEKLYALYM